MWYTSSPDPKLWQRLATTTLLALLAATLSYTIFVQQVQRESNYTTARLQQTVQQLETHAHNQQQQLQQYQIQLQQTETRLQLLLLHQQRQLNELYHQNAQKSLKNNKNL
jgi:hypothetical protein